MKSTTYRGSDVILVCYDMSSENSLLVDWISDIKTRQFDVPLYIVGCKSDIVRNTTKMIADRVGISRNIPVCETSIYNPAGVKKVIWDICYSIYEIKYPQTRNECVCQGACVIA